MNPIGLGIFLLLAPIVFAGSRRMALLALVAGVLYLPLVLQVNIGGLHVFLIRILELIAFARVISKKEFSFSELNGIDRCLILFYGYATVVFLIRSNEDLVFQIGVATDAFFTYFAFRGLCGDVEDFKQFLRSFVLVLVPYVFLLMIESLTPMRPFLMLGNVGTEVYRNGRVRAVGSFLFPSLMGTMGGSFLPLYIALWFTKNAKFIALAGIVLCLAVVWSSNSGGPAGCVLTGIVAWLLWPMRTRMSTVRRGLVAIIVLLAMFMKAPIWYLPSKLSDFTGGDGFHRSYLLEVSFRNLSRWWLAGMSGIETANWFPYKNSYGTADITNQFLAFGLGSGLGSMILFIVLLKRAFGAVGKAQAAVRAAKSENRDGELLIWGLGVVVAVHIINWLGIAYFDQISLLWFMQLACIATLSEKMAQSKAEEPQIGKPKFPRMIRSGGPLPGRRQKVIEKIVAGASLQT